MPQFICWSLAGPYAKLRLMDAIRACIQCKRTLHGRQVLYCGRQCKNRSTNFQHQIYRLQKQRGASRKWQLIQMLGGCCSRCGYLANLGALEFHHAGDTKEFQLDMRAIANRSWKTVLVEAKKCELLCSNCHAEVHRPDLAIENLRTLVGTSRSNGLRDAATSPPAPK
jgi:hypothetical protein